MPHMGPLLGAGVFAVTSMRYFCALYQRWTATPARVRVRLQAHTDEYALETSVQVQVQVPRKRWRGLIRASTPPLPSSSAPRPVRASPPPCLSPSTSFARSAQHPAPGRQARSRTRE
jgi:hypothetical protein